MILLTAAVALCGCGSPSKDEAQAAEALKPQPQTAEQKKMLESITKNTPANSEHAGVPAGH